MVLVWAVHCRGSCGDHGSVCCCGGRRQVQPGRPGQVLLHTLLPSRIPRRHHSCESINTYQCTAGVAEEHLNTMQSIWVRTPPKKTIYLTHLNHCPFPTARRSLDAADFQRVWRHRAGRLPLRQDGARATQGRHRHRQVAVESWGDRVQAHTGAGESVRHLLAL